MKKVTLLRDLLDKKAGDTLEVTDERADYWKRIGVAEAAKPPKVEKKEPEPAKEPTPTPVAVEAKPAVQQPKVENAAPSKAEDNPIVTTAAKPVELEKAKPKPE